MPEHLKYSHASVIQQGVPAGNTGNVKKSGAGGVIENGDRGRESQEHGESMQEQSSTSRGRGGEREDKNGGKRTKNGGKTNRDGVNVELAAAIEAAKAAVEEIESRGRLPDSHRVVRRDKKAR